MTLRRHLAGTALAASLAGAATAHPLDGLTAEEYQRINEILRAAGTIDDQTLFPLIEIREPAKADVLAWTEGDSLDRKAMVHYTGADGYREPQRRTPNREFYYDRPAQDFDHGHHGGGHHHD